MIQSELYGNIQKYNGNGYIATQLMINYLDYNYSNTKGATQAGTTFNSALIKNASDPNYTSNFVSNESVVLNVSGDTATGRVSWTPVITKEIKVFVADGGSTVSKTATVDASTGEFTVTFSTTPTGTTINGVVEAYYYDNESVQGDTNTNGYAGFGANVPEVELKMNSIPVEARARTLRSYWAFDAQYELQKELTSILS